MDKDFDHKIDRASDIHLVFDVPRVPEFPKIRELAEAFAGHVERWQSLGELPMMMSYWASQFSSARTVARLACKADPYRHDRDNEESFKKAYVHELRILDERKRMIADKEAGTKQARELGFGFTKLLLDASRKSNISEVSGGFHALMYALVTTGYAAFETFVGDLWVAALDTDHKIGEKYLGSLKSQGKEHRLDVRGNVGVLASSMGTAIRRQGMVAFTGLDEIREAYSNAFGQEAKALFTNSDLMLAAQCRHLIAHRSGLVDEKFQNKTKSSELFKGVRLGEQLMLDGDQVKTLSVACFATAGDTLKFVVAQLPDTGGAE